MRATCSGRAGMRRPRCRTWFDELGVQRGSLYAAFGDKHDLYLKAVALYDKENREHLQAILQDGPVLPALRRMLLDPSALTGAPGHPQGRRGCLVGNTTAELVPGNNAAPALAAAAYDGSIKVVSAAMARAQAAGEVTTSATPEAQARMSSSLPRLSTGVSCQPNRDSLAASIDATLDALRPHRECQARPPAGYAALSRFLLVAPSVSVCHCGSMRCGVHGHIADGVRTCRGGCDAASHGLAMAQTRARPGSEADDAPSADLASLMPILECDHRAVSLTRVRMPGRPRRA